ncbi:MAG: PhoX family protein [Bacteroidia bacterium]|nr:PhoX family protein [Bacteroidia bacterium]
MKPILAIYSGLGLMALGISLNAQNQVFQPVLYNYQNKTVVLPAGFSYQVLYSAGDEVFNAKGVSSPGKDEQDMVVYVPINNSSEHGWLYVSQEGRKPNKILGDGGGGTRMEIKKEDGKWKVVGGKEAIDFSTVGETYRNCGGGLTPHGTIVTMEEEFPTGNAEILKSSGIQDTSAINGKPRYLNYGWAVEVDLENKQALRKLKGFGRYRHEDAEFMPDGKTVYLSSDNKPSILFKFVADQAGDYTKGQLFAYQERADDGFPTWISLPMREDALENSIEIAVKRGATMFIDQEWLQRIGDKLYISESGSGHFDFYYEVGLGGRPAAHLERLCKKKGQEYEDPYGRILELDLQTNQIRVYLNGGVSEKDPNFCFASPDAMTVAKIKGKEWLVISEDSQGQLNGKASEEIVKRGETYNEVFFLDPSLKQPVLEDLQRFMMAPEGSETTGNMFTPDGTTYFVSIQHPNPANPAPFNKSCVLAITGF